MEYLSVLVTSNPQVYSFTDEVDEAINAKAALEWRLKQILQVRANSFLLVFEK